MTLEEIRSLIAGTVPSDWKVLAGDAPTYFERFVEMSGSEGHWIELGWHQSRAVLRRDLDVGLVWGMDTEHRDEALEPDWAEALGRKEVRARLVEVLYRGQPVDREVYGVVDGTRGRVPWPTARFAPDSHLNIDSRPEAYEVSSWHTSLVMLVSDLDGVVSDSVQGYMRRCNITVVA